MGEPGVTMIPPRSPAQVMTLARMGSFHQCRLSFMRVLLRRLKRDSWRFEQARFDIDENGVGVAVYTAHGPDRSYSLIAFAHDLPDEMRSDRVIATAWDATFTLFDGVPSQEDIDRLADNVPRQEAGRISESELSLSRANRSARMWSYVVECLARGEQPDRERIRSVGYVMRTTAVYGSGKFGAADRAVIEAREECQEPFQIEMLNVYLIRAFVFDLVDHMARAKAPETAVALDPALRRMFGIGNSTGLGMAPFLINHPVLLNNWIAAREEALARIRSISDASADEIATFRDRLDRADLNARIWTSDHDIQKRKLAELRQDLELLQAEVARFDFARPNAWDRLWTWAETALSLEGQEQLAALVLEIRPDLVDPLACCMAANEDSTMRIDGSMSVARLTEIVQDIYGWAIDIDWQKRAPQARIWYVSQEKLEPRLGERFEEDIDAYEQALCPGRDAARMYQDLAATSVSTVAAFLMAHPEHRHIARRAQIAARFPYAEIRSNTIAADMLPIDLLRAKLSFFGAVHFDPRSDRWVRINMFQNAPFPNELQSEDADDWTYPPLNGAD